MTEKKVILITGTSSGLGLALTQRLKASQHQIIATARPASIERLAETGIQP